MIAIGLAFSAISIAIAFVARVPTYRTAPLFLVPVVWAVYFLRRRLNLHWFHYLLFVSAMLLHNLGAFGYYQDSPFRFPGRGPISFDIVVHGYFGFVATFLFFRTLEKHVPVGIWPLRLFTLMFVMGSGAIHELIEYASYLMLGEEKGMLKPSTSYFFDTQRDLLNNFCGCLLALTLYGVYRWLANAGTRRQGFPVTAEASPPHGHAALDSAER
jgi:uncharacterized membrane protein YjdF